MQQAEEAESVVLVDSTRRWMGCVDAASVAFRARPGSPKHADYIDHDLAASLRYTFVHSRTPSSIDSLDSHETSQAKYSPMTILILISPPSSIARYL